MIDLSRLKSQASIAVLVFSAGLSAGGWGGWRLGHASADRAARVQAVQLARDNAVAVAMLRGAAERTAADMAARHPAQCAPADPWDPRWAIVCAATYDADLHRGMRAATRCDRWAMTLSAYNGGAGWIARDARKAAAQGLDPLRWWGHVETVNAGRAPVYWRENRGYPRRILRVIEPRYASWGPTACEVTP